MISPIEIKYNELDGETGVLGPPQGPENAAPDGIGRFRHYINGSIYWTPRTRAHEVHGGIFAKWASLGWERSWLGYPLSDETTGPDGAIRFNHFEGGSIYWIPFDFPGQGAPYREWVAKPYDISDKFHAARRNDGNTMAAHLKMYKQ